MSQEEIVSVCISVIAICISVVNVIYNILWTIEDNKRWDDYYNRPIEKHEDIIIESQKTIFLKPKGYEHHTRHRTTEF